MNVFGIALGLLSLDSPKAAPARGAVAVGASSGTPVVYRVTAGGTSSDVAAPELVLALGQALRLPGTSVDVEVYDRGTDDAEPRVLASVRRSATADRYTLELELDGETLERPGLTAGRAVSVLLRWLAEVGVLGDTPHADSQPVVPTSTPRPVGCKLRVNADQRTADLCGQTNRWWLVVDGKTRERNYATPEAAVTAIVGLLRLQTASRVTVEGDGVVATVERAGQSYAWSLQRDGQGRETGPRQPTIADVIGVLWERWPK